MQSKVADTPLMRKQSKVSADMSDMQRAGRPMGQTEYYDTEAVGIISKAILDNMPETFKELLLSDAENVFPYDSKKKYATRKDLEDSF